MTEVDVLLVGCPAHYASGLPEWVHPVAVPDWTTRPEATARPAVVVVGPAVCKPLHVAQRLAARYSECALLLITAPELVRETSNQLSVTPFVPLGTRVVTEGELGEALQAALLRAGSRRTQRRVAARVREVLSPGHGGLAEGGAAEDIDREDPYREGYLEAHADLQRALATRERLFSAVFESSEDAILSATMEGTITSWNKAAERLYEYTKAEALGSSIDFLVGDDRRAEMEEARKTLQAGNPIKGRETVHSTRGGRRAEVSLTMSLVKDPDGTAIGFSMIARDITERLREARAKAAILAGAFDAIVTMDGQGTVVEYNPAAEAMFGYAHAEAIGRPLADLIIPSGLREKHRQGLARYLATGEPHVVGRRLELTAVRKNGQEFPVEVGIVRLPEAQPPVFGGFIRDLTSIKAAEERLERMMLELKRSNQELEQFAYVASHDLQEPLRMVVAYMDLLERTYGESLDDKAKAFIGYAADGAKRLKLMVDDLLAYSRIESRGRSFEWCDSSEILAEVLGGLRLLISESSATIDCAPDLPRIWADGGQIGLSFQNLIANAIKFRGDDPPRIAINAERRGRFWEFIVQDNGIGFEDGQAERVFQMFQRLHDRTRYEGSGIGLALVKRIIERHGGRIWVVSAPDAGSRFHFTIPVAPVERGVKHER